MENYLYTGATIFVLRLFALILPACFCSRPASAALVSHWSLDENTGTTIVDRGPANNAGVLTNVGTGTYGWTNGRAGSAIVVSRGGTSIATNGGFVSIRNRSSLDFDTTNTFSVSAWIKIPVGNQQNSAILGKMVQAHGYPGYEIYYGAALRKGTT